MKPVTLIGILTLSATIGGASLYARAAANPDDEAIRATIQHYFDGGHEMRKGFYPDANMWYVRDGKLNHVPIQDFIARAEANADRPEGEVGRSIVSIDRFGNAAVAKLLIERPTSIIYDYMSLLKIDGEWKIVNKIFDVERTPKE